MRFRKRQVVVFGLGFLLLFQAFAHATFLYQINIKDKSVIKRLSDEALIDAYFDVIVELSALKSFHNTSGYTPKDYEQFKTLLRYKIDLILEMRKRELEVPDIEP